MAGRSPRTFAARARKWIARNPVPVRYTLIGCAIASLAIGALLIYYYVSFSRMIDARLHGERERSLPRVYARPVELRRGQTISQQELIARLNDLGYAQRVRATQPGEFTVLRNAVAIAPRGGNRAGQQVRVSFPAPPATPRAGSAPPAPPRLVQSIEIAGEGKTDVVQLDSPLVTALMPSGLREKRR